MIKLTDKWAETLLSQPETGMGYQLAVVRTKDGGVYRDVLIIGDTISSVAGGRDIPFKEADIESITVERLR